MRKSANQLGNPDLGENYQKFLKRGAVTVPSADYFPTLNLLEEYGASLILLPQLVGSGSLPVYHPNDGSANFTVSRDSIGTYFDRDGILRIAQPNEPRLDYDPVTREFKGVLVEPQITNLLLYSEQFNDNYWTKQGGISLNTTQLTQPPIISNIIQVTKTTNVSTPSGISRTLSLNGQVHTFSIFYKNINANTFAIRLRGANNDANIAVNTVSNTISQLGGNIVSSSITDFGGGFFRVTGVFNSINGNNTIEICNFFNTEINNSLYIWGAQLEVGSRATSYIPTSATAVTRQPDIIRKPDFTLPNNTVSFYSEYILDNYSDPLNLVWVSGNEDFSLFRIRIFFNFDSGVWRWSVLCFNNIDSPTTFINSDPILPNVTIDKLRHIKHLITMGIDTGYCKQFLNGQLLNEGTSSVPLYNITDSIFLGSLNTDSHFNNHIKAFSVINRLLTDQEAINLTKLN